LKERRKGREGYYKAGFRSAFLLRAVRIARAAWPGIRAAAVVSRKRRSRVRAVIADRAAGV